MTEVAGIISAQQVQDTADAIAARQAGDGALEWYPGGRLDPWNSIEAAMGLAVAGRHAEAAAAYRWLARRQEDDGSWFAAYQRGEPVDMTRDANFCAYIAAGAWHHYLATGDRAFADEMWPVVDAAIDFVLGLQLEDGAIAWARDPSYEIWPEPLLTSSSCIYLSMSCAIHLAEMLGHERLHWDLAAEELRAAVEAGRGFTPKESFAMDWYYPALVGALPLETARTRMRDGWSRFVIEGRGARCVAHRPWVTSGETSELVIALHTVGMADEAFELFGWLQHLRSDGGMYWTGATWPDGVVWPREQTTWSAGSVLLAADVLSGTSPTARFFDHPRRDDAAEPLETVSDTP